MRPKQARRNHHRDAYAEYYRVLARVRPRALKVPLDAILTAIDATDLAAAASPDDILPVANALTEALEGLSTEPFDMAERRPTRSEYSPCRT